MVFRQNSSEFEMPVFVNEVRSAREGSFWRRWQATGMARSMDLWALW